MTLQRLVTLTIAAILFSCGDPNPLYCEQHSDCNNANLSFCDVNGEYPDSNGVRKTCIANPIVLEVTVVGNGDVTSTPGNIDCGTVCSDAFATGTLLTLTAVPANSVVFTGWSGACTGTSDCSLMMDASKSVTATFVDGVQLAVAITDSSPGSGGQITSSPTGIDCPGVCSADFLEGSQVTLNATESPGSTFMGWSGEGCSGLADCSVTIGPGAKTVDAEFVEAGVFRWARTGGDAGDENGRDLAYDSQGNLVLIVNFAGNLNMGGRLFNRTTASMYVGKFNPQGNELWSTVYSNFWGEAVTVNDSGAVYVAGNTNGGTAFVYRLSGATGIQNASYSFFTAHQTNDMAIDSVGNLIVAGTRPAANQGSVTWLTPSLGQTVGVNVYGGTGNQSSVDSVAVTSTDTVVVTGLLVGTVDFNGLGAGGTLTSTGPRDAYLAEVGPGANVLWLKAILGNQSSAVRIGNVAVDANDNVYYGGTFTGTVDFAPGNALGEMSAGENSVYLINYTAQGVHMWSSQYGTGWLNDLNIDGRGNVLLTGGYVVANFGGGNLPTFGGLTDIFIASLQSDGAHRWSRGFGSSSDGFFPAEMGAAIAVSPNDEVAVCGPFQGTVDFGGGLLPSASGGDAFVFVRGP